MTSGAAVKYKNSMDCFAQVLKNEGFMSLMKGAGAQNAFSGLLCAGVRPGGAHDALACRLPQHGPGDAGA